ncbi:DUF5709 domain-containing protein [Pengzhenrongella phosphoraccumulans]|jgi:hypothetical protein|uniref:DUF5709 domain-containing protein n=1 Tax=Pengzhenrongella phosphoraccumulans TaxID=3114394 RepID=UPI00388F67B6
MTNETPATSADPETGTEGDTDQLTQEDTLIDRGVDDLLDEGYSPLDHPRANQFGDTDAEQERGESLDQRLGEEEPEVWVAPERGAREAARAGRLVADDDALDGHRPNDVFAQDVGVDGAGASAEEAAVRVVDEPND